ncbi:MAG: hypothetical protein Q4D55_07525 [Eubacteriales bacterium]|nr:hypothetical protein [Eubacteriales bacterium]
MLDHKLPDHGMVKADAVKEQIKRICEEAKVLEAGAGRPGTGAALRIVGSGREDIWNMRSC